MPFGARRSLGTIRPGRQAAPTRLAVPAPLVKASPVRAVRVKQSTPGWQADPVRVAAPSGAVLSYAALVASQGATFHLGFRGDTPYTDTVGGLVATPSGGVTLTDGPLAESGDKAAALDGTGLLSIPASAKPGVESFELEVWVNLSDISGWPVLWSLYDDAFAVNGLDVSVKPTGALAVSIADNVATAPPAIVSADGAVVEDVPILVTVQVDRSGGTLTGYLNTTQVLSGDISAITGTIYNADAGTIGNYADGSEGVIGTLAHPLIRVGSLSTPEQIAERYARLSYANLLRQQGFTSHWGFRDGTTSADTVGGLVATPTPGADVSAVVGFLAESGSKAVRIGAGGGWLVSPHGPAALDLGAGDFTLDCWVEIDAGYDEAYVAGFGKVDGAANSAGYGLTAQGGQGGANPAGWVDDGTSGTDKAGDGDGSAPLGAPHLLTFTRAGTAYALMADGALVSTAESGMGDTYDVDTAADLLIGAMPGWTNLKGRIGEVAIAKGKAGTLAEHQERYARRAGA